MKTFHTRRHSTAHPLTGVRGNLYRLAGKVVTGDIQGARGFRLELLHCSAILFER